VKDILQLSALDKLANVGPLLVRLITAFVMIPSGYHKLVDGAAEITEFVTKIGFPAPTISAWLATLAELVGGIFLALGLFTRWSGFFVAFTMAVAVYATRKDKYTLALVLMFTSISLIFSGAGKFSLDELLFRRSK
jgi:putative oxidoreductase